MVPDPIGVDSLRRVLVVKLRHHGDVLLTSPVFSVAGRPRAASRDRRPGVRRHARHAGRHPAVSRIHTIDREWKRQGLLLQMRREAALLSQLRERRYQLIVHLTDHWRGAWLAQLLRPRWAVAPARAGWLWKACFSHRYAMPRGTPRHTVELNLDALRRVGLYPAEDEKRLVMVPGPEAQAKVDALLAQHGLPPKGFLHVHPTSRWLFKAWTDERNAELLQRLARDGHRLVLTGAPNAREQAIVKRILERAGIAVTDLSGQLTLREMGALRRPRAAFLRVDSAPMHIAAAMGTPVVALFGPSGEREWGPWMVPHRIVASGHPCRPCGNDGCGGSKVASASRSCRSTGVHSAINELLAQP